jgi:hypothetical protein
VLSPEFRTNYDISTCNKFFENVSDFTYFGTTGINHNYIHKEVKSRLHFIVPCVVLYRCDTLFITIRKEYTLRVFEIRALGPKAEEVTGGWGNLHYGELHSLCSSLNIIREINWRKMKRVSHVARIGEMRNTYYVLKGRDQLERLRHRLEDSIKKTFARVVTGE